ncbi:MAG: hypothetical protein EON60_12535 [Alphaproteobacteria bacterium]|nr:MAG: hypothetical protein EON60_12535 [Alphaproteobacteria bacterium]
MADDTTKLDGILNVVRDSMSNGMPALTPVEDDYNAKIANGTGHTATQKGNGAARADGFYEEQDTQPAPSAFGKESTRR